MKKYNEFLKESKKESVKFDYFNKSKDFNSGELKIELSINGTSYRYILNDFAYENYINSNIKYKPGDVLNFIKTKAIKSEKYDIKEKEWLEI